MTFGDPFSPDPERRKEGKNHITKSPKVYSKCSHANDSAVGPKRDRMCLIACVFEDFGNWEEIRVAFFRFPGAFRGNCRADVLIASDTAALERGLQQGVAAARSNGHGGA